MDVIELYSEQLEEESKEYRLKHPKTDSKYRASSSGTCSRKIYFESIEKAEKDIPTTPEEIKSYKKSQRIMRLGTIVHEDVQKMLLKYIENNK